ncbi:Predicted nuclease of the RNAse H fold, HicB family [Gulbenkiania indica]|uniref:Predicted nuclease of the RNAse H fold, HicB family n=1 Tax=Gulbenkiania indica TaxID=375574 RepID=A0A0K6GUA2_9NEIS|nr:type II toxin-antitoxin system HicB family antitoxin [Gulbenkiania indica]CUA82067.1 Predicted nuclease of the RNAse H fold, HicB family [Gulbenkiania indica]
MLYPIAIEPGDDQHAYGVIVPDIPGCFSAGDTLDEAMKNAHEAIDGHLSLLAEDDQAIPMASTVQAHMANPEYAGFIWAVVDVDITQYLGKATKLNVTLPASLIRRIDDFVATHPEYKSRSGFLAKTALEKLISSQAA